MPLPDEEVKLVTSSKIPVRNLWLLQLFASRLYQTRETALSGVESMPDDLPDAVARLLLFEAEQRLRQSLTTGFRRQHDQLRRVRGRIDILDTYRHRCLDRARVSCRFDEIVVDTPGNRMVRAALARAGRIVSDKNLAQQARGLQERFRALGIGDSPPRSADITSLLSDRTLARDRRMLCAAELLLSLQIPAPGGGGRASADVAADDDFLRKLYEHAVRGFYRHRLTPEGWYVRPANHGLEWDIESSSEGLEELLPKMETDIELSERSTGRHIVIDTKFTSVTSPNYQGRQRFKSGHIYQIYAYLMSQRDRRPSDLPRSEGILLYPVVGGHVDEEAVMHGHRMRFYTIDLAAPSDVVVQQLLDAIAESP